jgi:hypothetical protein
MVGFKGSTQEPPSHKATASQGNQIRFGYRKAVNDPAAAGVPDRVGSGVFVLDEPFVRHFRALRAAASSFALLIGDAFRPVDYLDPLRGQGRFGLQRRRLDLGGADRQCEYKSATAQLRLVHPDTPAVPFDREPAES